MGSKFILTVLTILLSSSVMLGGSITSAYSPDSSTNSNVNVIAASFSWENAKSLISVCSF